MRAALVGGGRAAARLGGREVALERGGLARLAAGAALAKSGDGVLLATACQDPWPATRPPAGFVALGVEFREKASAAGKIPGHVLRRELAPREAEVVQARFVDRAVRPLFGEAVRGDHQVICTVLSYDAEADLESLAVNASSVAIATAAPRVDWRGPVGCVRVTGRVNPAANDEVLLSAFQPPQNMAEPDPDVVFELLMTGTREGVVSLDLSSARPVPCETFQEALRFAWEKLPEVLDLQVAAIKAILEENRRARASEEEEEGEDAHATPRFPGAVLGDPSAEPEIDLQPTSLDALYQMAFAADAPTGKGLAAEGAGDANDGESIDEGTGAAPDADLQRDKDMEFRFSQRGSAWLREQAQADSIDAEVRDKLRSFLLRPAVGDSGDLVRHDGRAASQLRSLASELDVLPLVVHGSSTFSRGQTSVLATVTLGSSRDALRVLPYCGQTYKKRFYVHYEFPPYSVNETGRVGLNRRMIGHGQLAEKALRPVMPDTEGKGGDAYPFSTRVSVETTSSDGSSSMASVCAASLALKMAGVPLSGLVAGISVGLVHDSQGAAGSERLLVDVDSLEDDLGGMDFKLAGTRSGFTAGQLDTKQGGRGVSVDLLCEAAELAHVANGEILDELESTLEQHEKAQPKGGKMRSGVPLFRRINVDPALIGRVLGMRGRKVAWLQDEYDVEIDVEQDQGRIIVFGRVEADLDTAQRHIEDLAWLPEVGRDYKDLEIIELNSAGAIVRFPDHGGDHEGFIHVSELSTQRIDHPEDVYSIGDRVTARCVSLEDFRTKLSIRDILAAEEREAFMRKRQEELRALMAGNTSAQTGQSDDSSFEAEDQRQRGSTSDEAEWEPEVDKMYEGLKVVKIPHPSRVIVEFPEHPESRGVIPAKELSPRRVDDANKVVQVGDRLDAVCMSMGREGDGLPELSVRRTLLRGKGTSSLKTLLQSKPKKGTK